MPESGPLDALARLRSAYDDRLGEGRRRRDAGSRLVGYFLNTIPIELIIAAGLDPIRLTGNRARKSPIAEAHLETFFDGEVQSIFGSFFEGDFDFVELAVIPRSLEAYRWLYYMLGEAAKYEPQAKLVDYCLFDILQTEKKTTFRYVLGRTHALAAQLSALGGATIGERELGDAIARTNRLRRLLRQARALWNGPERYLDGVDALKVIGGASVLSLDEAIASLEALLAAPLPAPLPKRPHILLKGSAQHDGLLTGLIEGAGGAVVAHDHEAGDLTYDMLIAEDGDPFEAVARHYQCHAPSVRSSPQAVQDKRMMEFVAEGAVEAVVFYHDQWDDALGWDYPGQRRMLQDRGIPSLMLARHDYFAPPVDTLREQISDFIRTLPGGAQ